MDRAVLETASDRYVIVEYIAEGGMGAIYLGKKIGVGGFEKEVVLKQLLPEFTREPKFIDLFLREARLSASLDHANIVRTVDLVTAGEDYFIVMEYVRGGDLRTLMKRARRRHQRFPPQAALFIAHEILEALSYAHSRLGSDGRKLGLIHRDVSPSNILLSGAGEVKLTDFGIAKASTHRSVFFKVKGKVGYMSPEQARGEPIDARSDLFSLGVVLYEVLVGERLFVGDLMSTAAAIYSQPIAPPSKRRPELPPELDEVLLKALSLDRRGRYQTPEEFQDALSRVAAKRRLLCGASEMASILRQVCGEDPSQWLRMEALAYAHDRKDPSGQPLGLIHRDITPSNILVSAAGEVKLTDFGIAKASTQSTVFFKVKGKVGYMSPEQARGDSVEARSDLFSLGVVLYEVLVGERLFVGNLLSTASSSFGIDLRLCDGGVIGCEYTIEAVDRRLPTNSRSPTSTSYSTTPSEKRSLRASTDSPRACSGDM